MHRYAVYFTTPPGHRLTRAAEAWLGRSAEGRTVAATGAGAEDPAWVRQPARYGFHATLKPPFRLAEGKEAAALQEAFDAFCSAQPPMPPVRLEVGQIGAFFALVPCGEAPGLAALADAAVRAFEPFRALLSDAELAKRNPDRLSARQRDYLARWGYPYIFDEFRFHMTLTGSVETGQRARVASALAARFGPLLEEPVSIDGLALFGEPAANSDFQLLRRCKLGKTVQAETS